MKLRIFLKSFNKKLINLASKNLYLSLLELNSNSNVSKIIALPIKIKKFCVLRSPHIDKDSREQFEFRSYKHFIDFELYTPEFLIELFKIELPAGISCLLKVLEY